VDRNIPATSHLGHRLHVGFAENSTAATVVGVLQADQPRTRVMDVGKANGLLDVLGMQATTVIVRDRPQLQTTQGSRSRHLVAQDMSLIAQEHLGAPLAVGQQGHQVAHGAAGRKQARLLPQLLGGHGLQAIDRGVLAPDVVAQLGLGYGLAHGRRGQGDGIASEVNDLACHDAPCTSARDEGASGANKGPNAGP